MSFAGERVLCVTSHPDDETIGCGATLARAAREGAAVRVYLPFRRLDVAGRVTWEDAVAQLRRASDILGAEVVVAEPLLAEHDVWSAPHVLAQALVPQLEWATLVITHWHGDVHQAHRAVSQAIEIGTRPFRLRRRVLQCEIPTSSDQSFVRGFTPNLFVIIEAADARRKLDAMACYPQEHAPGRHPDTLDRWMRVRGEQVGVERAEAFAVARWYL